MYFGDSMTVRVELSPGLVAYNHKTIEQVQLQVMFPTL